MHTHFSVLGIEPGVMHAIPLGFYYGNNLSSEESEKVMFS